VQELQEDDGVRRNKPFSCRPKKLTEAEEQDLIQWYYSARTVPEKARELRISERAVYDYIFGRHKPRKETDIDRLADEITSRWREVSVETNEERACTQAQP
jgi:hypothetical protein